MRLVCGRGPHRTWAAPRDALRRFSDSQSECSTLSSQCSNALSGLYGGGDKHAFDLVGELLLQRLQGEELVPEDEAVIEQVGVRHAVFAVKEFGVAGEEDSRLWPVPILFPDPSEFSLVFLDMRAGKEVVGSEGCCRQVYK